MDIEFGTALHLAIKTMFDGDDHDAIFLMYWDSIKDKKLHVSRFDWDHLKELGLVFLERFKKLHFKKFKPFKIEQEMLIDFEGHQLQGTADFIGDYEGIPTIADWKTSRSEYKERKILTNEQMYIYAYMAKTLFNFTAEQIVYKVFIKAEERIQTLKVPLTEAKLNDMIGNVRLMVKDLASKQDFPRNPNCYCTFQDKCYPGGLKNGQ